jgi:hypothetical protein
MYFFYILLLRAMPRVIVRVLIVTFLLICQFYNVFDYNFFIKMALFPSGRRL